MDDSVTLADFYRQSVNSPSGDRWMYPGIDEILPHSEEVKCNNDVMSTN